MLGKNLNSSYTAKVVGGRKKRCEMIQVWKELTPMDL
jgi:hypothetical protein